MDPADRRCTVPNFITFGRLALVPAVGWFLMGEDYAPAFAAFLTGAASDGLDGLLARRLNQISALGAALDPIADKLMLLTTTVLLAWDDVIPIWLAGAIVARDAIILTGAAAYRKLAGRLDITPTLLGKFNTFLEFGILAAALATAAGLVPLHRWLPALFWIVFLTTVASGIQYVWVWGRKAATLDHGG